MRNSLIVVLIGFLLSGCASTPGRMIGKSLSDVEDAFGKPDGKSAEVVKTTPYEVPMPVTQLQPGDPFLFVIYPNLDSRQWWLTFVSPELYEKRKGSSPGSEKWYLIEAIDFDKDLVF